MYASSASALSSLSPEAKQMLTNGAKAEEIANDILWRKRMVRRADTHAVASIECWLHSSRCRACGSVPFRLSSGSSAHGDLLI